MVRAHRSTHGHAAFATSDPSVSERDEFDYVDLRYDRLSRPNLPHSFGGIRGSGLWQVKLPKSRSTGDIAVGSLHLEGVAFNQVALSPDIGLIRCHGRKSLYSRIAPAAKRVGR